MVKILVPRLMPLFAYKQLMFLQIWLFAFFMVTLALVSGCSITRKVIAEGDGYNALYLGDVTMNGSGKATVKISSLQSNVTCEGLAQLTRKMDTPSSNCLGQGGIFTASCTDGRRIDGVYDVDTCTSGRGKGKDQNGVLFSFAFGYTEQQAKEWVATRKPQIFNLPLLPSLNQERFVASQLLPSLNQERFASQLTSAGESADIKRYQEDVRKNPNDAVAHHNLGVAYANLGRHQEAIPEYKEAIRLKPDFADAHFNLGVAYSWLQRFSEAIPEYKEAIRLKPDYAGAHYGLGTAFARLQRYAEAVPELKEAIRLKPDDADAHNNLGAAYSDLQRYSEAIPEYKEAIRLKPDYAGAHYNLGHAYFKLQRYTEAVPEFKEAIRLKPDYADAHFTLGTAYNLLQRYSEAVPELKEGIRLKPDFAGAHNGLGTAYNKLQRYAEAVPEYKEAIRLKPDDADAHNGLGTAYNLLQRYSEAVPEYKEAIRLKPDDALAHYNLGVAYSWLQRYSEAVPEYKEAIRLKPDLAEAHNNLGVAYNEMKNGSGAIVEMTIASKLFERQKNVEMAAMTKKSLRDYYSRYGYKQEDFANVEIPGENKPRLTNPPQTTKSFSEPTAPVRAASLGSGVAFNQSASVFTSYHVVRGSKSINVRFVSGEIIPATISYMDEANDIAMLSLARTPNIQLRHLPLGDVSKVKMGEKVFTIGYPASHILGKEPKYSEGVVNSLTGAGDDARMFQISTPIQAGNSGGALFNERGEVIGLIKSTYVTSEALIVSGTMPQNVNFAVKSSLFAGHILTGISDTSIVPVPTPFSVSDFIAGVKNNIVLIEAE